MIVSVSGYNWSGSSAIMDLLNEYYETSVIYNPEWYLLDQVDGIRDLDYHISGVGTYFCSDVAIKRFMGYCLSHDDYQKATNGKFYKLSKDYIDSLIQIKWKGYSVYDVYYKKGLEKIIWELKNIVGIILSKTLSKDYSFNDRTMYFSINPYDFEEKTQKYISDLLHFAGGSKDKINVVKQLFPANNPYPYFKYVKDAYVIIVDRDPRDIYIQCRRINVKCFPNKDVEQFVKYYKRFRMLKSKENKNDEKILRIQFEDLNYNYEETVYKIEKFLNIKKHVDLNKHFNPEKSIKTTCLYLNDNIYKEEIKYIENNLEEYLYIV